MSHFALSTASTGIGARVLFSLDSERFFECVEAASKRSVLEEELRELISTFIVMDSRTQMKCTEYWYQPGSREPLITDHYQGIFDSITVSRPQASPSVISPSSSRMQKLHQNGDTLLSPNLQFSADWAILRCSAQHRISIFYKHSNKGGSNEDHYSSM